MFSSILHSPSPFLLSVANGQRAQKINLRLLKQITEVLLAELEIQDAELEINLVSAGEMTRLNEKFLRHQGSTDVITFDYGLSVRRDAKTRTRLAETLAPPKLHGEIFICTDEAVLQARKFRTTWQSEVTRYLIHGILHLLGHDDSRSRGHRKMRQEENRLLRQLSRRFSLAQLSRPAKLSGCKSP